MSLESLFHRMNNLLVRFKLDGSDDSDKMLRVHGQGRVRELYGTAEKRILAHQPGGLSHRPSPGALGLIFNLGGNNDQSMAAFLGHPDKRPTGLEEGETVVWNERGDTIKLDKDGTCTITCKQVRFVVEEKVVVESPLVYLGGEAGAKEVAVKDSTVSGGVIDGACSTKVFAAL